MPSGHVSRADLPVRTVAGASIMGTVINGRAGVAWWPLALAATCGVLASTPARAEPIRLKVMTFNVWYGGEQVDFQTVIAAIKAADADIVGLQEPDANTRRIADLAGYPFVDIRRHILSRYPLFDPGEGGRTSDDLPAYSIAGVDPKAIAAYVVVAPGRMAAVANTHLTSDPYGPDLARTVSPRPRSSRTSRRRAFRRPKRWWPA